MTENEVNNILEINSYQNSVIPEDIFKFLGLKIGKIFNFINQKIDQGEMVGIFFEQDTEPTKKLGVEWHDTSDNTVYKCLTINNELAWVEL